MKAIYQYGAELMKAGMPARQIESKLVEKGLNQEAAASVVKNLSLLRTRALKQTARKNMLYGALWCIGGIAVTVATLAAAQGGGTYVVAWGAIIFGAIQFFRGFAQSIDR